MVLKNLMEDKQLNFNQPLLSVRRFSSMVTSRKVDGRKTDNKLPSAPDLPYYKSELKSGPVRNAGTIPFIWEQSPGRPKYEGKPQTNAVEGLPVSQNPPPGRISKPRQLDYDKICEHSNVHNCNAEVYYEVKNAGVPSLNENETKFKSSKDRVEDSSDSRYGDDVYLDALDTLSRSESVNLNCRVSGMSGLDGPGVKPSGIFSADQQTQDFMMGRFLPAGRAMASKTLQYAPMRPAVVEEQPRQIKVVSKEKCPPLQYGPNIASHYAQENEEEESDDEFDELGRLSDKICGLLPRFCLKNSFFLLNPVPGMSMRTQTPMSSFRGRQARTLSGGSSTVTKNEFSKIAYSGHRQTTVGALQTNVFHVDNGILKNGSKCHSNQKLKESSTYRLPKGSSMSPWHNKLPQSFHTQNDLTSCRQVAENAGISEFISLKNTSNSVTNVADHNNNIDISPATPTVEKTVYVDIVHNVGSPKQNAYSSVMKGPPSLRGDEFEIITKCEEKEETFSVDSSHKENLSIVEKTNLQPDVKKPFESIVISSAAKSKQEVGMDKRKNFEQNGDLYQNYIILANSKSPENINFLGHEVPWSKNAETSENSSGANSEFSAPPPLPKSPSDSWLCRTLGSVSSRNAAPKPYLGAGMNPRTQGSATSSDAEFPTTIKAAKELMRSIPEE